MVHLSFDSWLNLLCNNFGQVVCPLYDSVAKQYSLIPVYILGIQ